jgi:hypothetical protein
MRHLPRPLLGVDVPRGDVDVAVDSDRAAGGWGWQHAHGWGTPLSVAPQRLIDPSPTAGKRQRLDLS